MPPSALHPPLLRFEGIDKSFDGIRVLRSVTLDVLPGRILGLIGENGAGKSTLMNVLGGNLAPDAGRMFRSGAPYAPRSPADAASAGIAFVHQELNLFSNLTIAENLFLTRFPRRPGLPLIDRGALRRRAQALIERVGLTLAPDTPLDRLSAGERQLVELAGALGSMADLILLDEPTTSLTARESGRFFELMGRLRNEGFTLIFISHALPDVLRECDDLVILRDGAVADAGPASAFDIPRMVQGMVGRDLGQLFPVRRAGPRSRPNPDSFPDPSSAATSAAPLLDVRGVGQPGVVENISFRLHHGEILGLAGLMGAGRSETARILFGLDPYATGEILLDGEPIREGARGRQRAGVAFLTEDRRHDGLFPEASIADNMTLVALSRFARNAVGWLNQRGLADAVRTLRAAVHLTPSARDGQPVRTLSGGNQQKVILARWLLARPRLLILDEPTRGIDVGARFEIYQLIQQLADEGAGILMISSELEELLGLCDRILVMSQGRLRDDIQRAEFSQERILRAALPA